MTKSEPDRNSKGLPSNRHRRFFPKSAVRGHSRQARRFREADMMHIERLEVSIGGLSRAELLSRLSSRGIHLNAHAETLLENAVFDKQPSRVVTVTERTVAALGRPDGASLSQILELAWEQGLLLCPADTGPYLRLALNDQTTSADSVMSSGKAPTGALTVATDPLSDDDDHPKGFYLRVVDGQLWLRGYRCDDEHTWSADDRFVFRLPPQSN